MSGQAEINNELNALWSVVESNINPEIENKSNSNLNFLFLNAEATNFWLNHYKYEISVCSIVLLEDLNQYLKYQKFDISKTKSYPICLF